MAKYFNNHFLDKILSKYQEMKIYVDHEYLSIFDRNDILDPNNGVGYDSTGKPIKFKYVDIELIKVGQDIIDLKSLNQDPEEEKTEEEPSEPKEKPSKEPEKKEPEKKQTGESISKGDRVTVTDQYNGYGKGIVERVESNLVHVKLFDPKKLRYNLVITDIQNVRRN